MVPLHVDSSFTSIKPLLHDSLQEIKLSNTIAIPAKAGYCRPTYKDLFPLPAGFYF